MLILAATCALDGTVATPVLALDKLTALNTMVVPWIDAGNVRTPIYICELNPAKLRKAAATSKTYYYDDITIDPRYEETPPARGAKYAER